MHKLAGISDKARRNALSRLRDPMWALPRYGYVKNFLNQPQLVDFNALDDNQGPGVAAYGSDPASKAYNDWLVELKYRQAGRSTIYEMAALCKAMFTPGYDHVCLADHRGRAHYLHRRAHYSYKRWPAGYKPNKVTNKESNQLTLDDTWGGIMRTLTAQNAEEGIGQTPDGFHASECGFYPDLAERLWSELWPSLTNRPRAHVVFECVPTVRGGWWHNLCDSAQRGDGRFRFRFTPFFASGWPRIRKGLQPELFHCWREWQPEWSLENEELRLLEKYGEEAMKAQGKDFWLTKGHLAFRRMAMEEVSEIAKDPGRFPVLYPFDPLSCWTTGGKKAISQRIMDRLLSEVLVEWPDDGDWVEYNHVESNADYVIGCDPNGFGVRDHAAAHIFRANLGEERQVACWADNVTDPPELAKILVEASKKWNDAEIFIEGNGVGAGVISSIITMGEEHRLYYRDTDKPGWDNNPRTYQEYGGYMLDGLRKKWTIKDADTVAQLGTYQNDKLMEASARQEAAEAYAGRKGKRRPRHHWDKVSGLLSVAVAFTERVYPARRKAEVYEVKGPSDTTRLSYNDRRQRAKEEAALKKKLAKEAKKGRRRKLARAIREKRRAMDGKPRRQRRLATARPPEETT